MLAFVLRDVGAFLQLPEELAKLSLTCKQHKALLQFMLHVLRDNVWCSSNVRLDPKGSFGCSSSSEGWQAWCPTGIPMKSTNFANKAYLRMYETRSNELVLENKDLQFSAFHEGEHYEPFNKLHGYWTLSEAPMLGRYQSGHGYPYIGLSATASANTPPELCMHSSEFPNMKTVLAFHCPANGVYMISNVSLRFFDKRTRGAVTLQVGALKSGRAVHTDNLHRAITVSLKLEEVHLHNLVSFQLEGGDQIVFGVSSTDFCCAAMRVSWKIRRGVS